MRIRDGALRRTLTALAIVGLARGCSCGSSPQLVPSANVGPKDDSTQVTCGCQIQLVDSEDCRGGLLKVVPDPLVVVLPLCLPPSLNLAQDGGAADATDEEWQGEVTDYCTNAVNDLAREFYAFETKNGCDHNCIQSITCSLQPTPLAPDGAVTSAFATASNPTCAAPCGAVNCDYTNCSSDQVEKGTSFDISACKCTVLQPFPWAGGDASVEGGCGVTGPSNIFCTNPPGNQDPPTLKSGLLTNLLTGRIQTDVEYASSSLKMTVSFEDFSLTTRSDTETFNVAGSLILNGDCAAGASCDAYLEMELHGADTTFTYNNVVCGLLCTENIKATASDISILGGMGSTLVHIDASGMGTIPMNALSYRANAVIDGIPGKSKQRELFDSTNDRPISFLIDFAAKTFSIPGAPITFDDGTATLVLSGVVVNQPPHANAGTPQTVECTSPTGGKVTLDASASTDPDNDIAGWEWWTGHALTGGNSVGSGKLASIIAPFTPPKLTTPYELSVFDSHLDTSIRTTSVTVVDTLPPVITLSASPSCLWPPNHKMVLFELGKELAYTVQDACDLHPDVRIIDVTSNQPPLGRGSGQTNPDVEFGAGAFCVRAERDGALSTDRQYTVTVQATDSSGNKATKQIVVVVQHDQQKTCPNTDASRYVDDTDARCTEGL